jgi:hypothetical protein
VAGIRPAQPDDVDEVSGVQGREPDLNPAGCPVRNHHHLARPRYPLVNDQVVAGALDDCPGHPADAGPDPVGDGPLVRAQPDDGPVTMAQRRGL